MERLDPERLKALIRRADDKWYAEHHGKYNYQEHLEFLADYIARNYNRHTIKAKKRPLAPLQIQKRK